MDISCNFHAKSFTAEDAFEDPVFTLTDEKLGLKGEYIFMYTYPLRTVARIPHVLLSENSAISLLLIAQKDYMDIYAVEEEAEGNPGHIPGMLNRGTTNGPYGIWGHDFEDLYFENINIDNVNRVITFEMGS